VLDTRRTETTIIGNPTTGSNPTPSWPIQGTPTGYMQTSKPVADVKKAEPIAPAVAVPAKPASS